MIINDLVPTDQFYTMLAQASFVILPLQDVKFSCGDSVMIKAMAAGKAVIATKSPSSEIHVVNGETGLLIPPADPDCLREAILYLIDHPDVNKDMGRKARIRYEKFYTPEAVAIERYKIFKDVCGEKP